MYVFKYIVWRVISQIAQEIRARRSQPLDFFLGSRLPGLRLTRPSSRSRRKKRADSYLRPVSHVSFVVRQDYAARTSYAASLLLLISHYWRTTLFRHETDV